MVVDNKLIGSENNIANLFNVQRSVIDKHINDEDLRNVEFVQFWDKFNILNASTTM